MTAQVHKSKSEWRLCHTDCKYMDAGTLSSWLKEIKAWMDKNPNEGGLTPCTVHYTTSGKANSFLRL